MKSTASENKRILVLGLNGIIGWHLFQVAKEVGPVHGTFRRKLKEFDKSNCHRIDIRRISQITKLFDHVRPHFIFHAWSMCDLDVCQEHPELAKEINVQGTRHILEAAKSLKNLTKFVYISTDHVFDGEKGGYDESDQPMPRHVYGQTKVEAENLVLGSQLPALIIRPGLIIGESVQGNKGPQDFLMSRLREGKSTRFFEDEWRSPIRAERFAGECLRLALSKELGVFHVAGKKAYNRYEFAERLAERYRFDTKNIVSVKRKNDAWASIRPKNLSLVSKRLQPIEDF